MSHPKLKQWEYGICYALGTSRQSWRVVRKWQKNASYKLDRARCWHRGKPFLWITCNTIFYDFLVMTYTSKNESWEESTKSQTSVHSGNTGSFDTEQRARCLRRLHHPQSCAADKQVSEGETRWKKAPIIRFQKALHNEQRLSYVTYTWPLISIEINILSFSAVYASEALWLSEPDLVCLCEASLVDVPVSLRDCQLTEVFQECNASKSSTLNPVLDG